MKYWIWLLSIVISYANAIPIENDISGPIEVECTKDSIDININTINPWAGKLYAKDHNEIAECSVS